MNYRHFSGYKAITSAAVEAETAEYYKPEPVTVRKMTAEEWKKYGKPVKTGRRKNINSVKFEW